MIDTPLPHLTGGKASVLDKKQVALLRFLASWIAAGFVFLAGIYFIVLGIAWRPIHPDDVLITCLTWLVFGVPSAWFLAGAARKRVIGWAVWQKYDI